MKLKQPSSLVVAVLSMNYIMELNRTTDSRFEITGGMEGLYLKDILEALGLEYQVVVPADREYGTWRSNDSWTGLIGMVQRGEADIAFSALTVTEKRKNVVEFSIPYYTEPLSFAIGKPKKEQLKNAFLYPFKYRVWEGFLCMLISMSAVLYMVFERKYSLGRILLVVFGNVMRQPLMLGTNTVKSKIVISLWLLCAYVLSSSYSGALLSFLTLPTQRKTVEDFIQLSEVVSKGTHKTFVMKGSMTSSYFRSMSQQHLKLIGSSIERNSWYYKASDFRRKGWVNENTAFITGLSSLQFAFFKQVQDSRVYISKDTISGSSYGIALSPQFCCRVRLNEIITRSLYSGLLTKHYDDILFRHWLAGLLKGNKDVGNISKGQLSFWDISGVLHILLSGYIASFIALLGELLFYKYSINSKLKQASILNL